MTDHIADRFARIHAEYNAIKKLYEAAKAEALGVCLDAAGDDLKAYVAGEEFALDFSLTAVNTFSSKKAKEFLTEEQIAACMVQESRQNMKPKLLAKITVLK